MRKGAHFVLGEIGDQRFQGRWKKLETINKTQLPQRKTDVTFSGLSDTRRLSAFEFSLTFTLDESVEVAHAVQNYGHEIDCLQFRLQRVWVTPIKGRVT